MKNRIHVGALLASMISLFSAVSAYATQIERFEISSVRCMISTSGSGGLLMGAYVNPDGSVIPNKLIRANYETCTKISAAAFDSMKCGKSISADLIIDETSAPGIAVGVKNLSVAQCEND